MPLGIWQVHIDPVHQHIIFVGLVHYIMTQLLWLFSRRICRHIPYVDEEAAEITYADQEVDAAGIRESDVKKTL